MATMNVSEINTMFQQLHAQMKALEAQIPKGESVPSGVGDVAKGVDVESGSGDSQVVGSVDGDFSGGFGSTGSSSWADDAEEEEVKRAAGERAKAGDKVLTTGNEVVSGKVKGVSGVRLKFPDGNPVQMPADWQGGVDKQVVKFGAAPTLSGAFFSTYVRTPAVKELNGSLQSWGVSISRKSWEELSLTRFSQGCVPDAFVEGKERLKVLAKVGDNAMLLALTDSLYAQGKRVAAVQADCAKVLSRTNLSKICVGSGLSEHLIYPSGIDLHASSVAGEMLEAVAGVVYHALGVDGIKIFMKGMQLLH